METLAVAVSLALAASGPDSPEFDRALVALAAAAREEGLRGTEALAVLVSALRGEPVPVRDSLPLG